MHTRFHEGWRAKRAEPNTDPRAAFRIRLRGVVFRRRPSCKPFSSLSCLRSIHTWGFSLGWSGRPEQKSLAVAAFQRPRRSTWPGDPASCRTVVVIVCRRCGAEDVIMQHSFSHQQNAYHSHYQSDWQQQPHQFARIQQNGTNTSSANGGMSHGPAIGGNISRDPALEPTSIFGEHSEEGKRLLDWVSQVLNANTRETALLELSKKREQVGDLALILWHSFGKRAACCGLGGY